MIYEFSDLTLDLDRHLLTRGGQPIKLTKLSFKVLQALVRAAPALISHDDLIDEVWGPRRVITPDNLSQRMKTLRQSLGDDTNQPIYIEGVRGEGYRLVPEVKIQSAQTSSRSSWRGLSSRFLLSLAVLALALGYIAFDKFVLEPVEDAQLAESARQEGHAAARAESHEDKSLAVLPFDNRSSTEGDQFFTDGMHDELLATIAKIGSMKVISRTSVMEYRDTTKKIPQIAQELDVEHILEGGIQRSGNQVRINVQLIDAATDEHVWAEIYDRELTAANLFAVQSEITKKIADALQTELSTDEQRRIDAKPTDNLQAYELYLRGRYLWQRRGDENIRNAIALFEQATELDPQFARAWSSLAATHFTLPVYSDSPRREHNSLAASAAHKALAQDESLAEAYAVLGGLADMDGKWAEAETLFLLAIANEPMDSTAHLWYGEHLFKLGRLDDALEAGLIAYQLDPLHPATNAFLGWIYLYLNDTSNALKYGAAAWDLGHASGLYFQAWINLHSGEIDRAIGFAGQWDALMAQRFSNLQNPPSLQLLIEAKNDAAKRPPFLEMLAAQETIDLIQILLTGYVGFERIDEAHEVAAMALDLDGFNRNNFEWYFWDSDMAPFRQDPQFAALVTELGMVDYWREYGWPDVCQPTGDSVICK
ncbi:MAG: winged helix-turn-helix domain-containing protein [Xanthomonadales bacterium]|nr:winged helix-turn-helix domain-containing protein [Xanthomonadales bacterium]